MSRRCAAAAYRNTYPRSKRARSRLDRERRNRSESRPHPNDRPFRARQPGSKAAVEHHDERNAGSRPERCGSEDAVRSHESAELNGGGRSNALRNYLRRPKQSADKPEEGYNPGALQVFWIDAL